MAFELLSGRVPFSNQHMSLLYETILRNKPDYPSGDIIGKAAKEVLGGLMTSDPKARLNGTTIRSLAWFDGFDWDKLESLEVVPPFTPSFNSAGDPGNFIEYDQTDNGEQEQPLTAKEQELFAGF